MNYLDLIQMALFNLDNKLRSEAEQTLTNEMTSNTSNFFQNLINILINQNYQPNLRQSAGILVKRAIEINNSQNLWFTIDSIVQYSIKTNLLQNLNTSDSLVRNTTAMVIASISFLEIPLNQWPEIITILKQNTINPNVQIVKSSILTLGYICENLKKITNQFNFDQKNAELIGEAIYNCLSQTTHVNEELLILSLQALQNSLKIIKPLFEQNKFLISILECLVKPLTQNKTTNQNLEIQIKAIQCLIDFTKINFRLLLKNYNDLFIYLKPFISHPDHTLAIIAIELWDQVIQNEINYAQKNQNYQIKTVTKNIANELTVILLQNLQKIDENEDPSHIDEDNNSLIQISSRCLNSIVEATNDQVLPLLQNFINIEIYKSDWNSKRAAITTFTCLFEGQSQQIENLIAEALPTIVNFLNDENNNVKNQAALFFQKCAEIYPQILISSSDFNNILQKILAPLQQDPIIATNICKIFSELSQNFSNISLENQFTSQLQNIFEQLIRTTLRQDLDNEHINLIDIAYIAVIDLIHNLHNEQICSHYLQKFLAYIQEVENSAFKHKQSIFSGLFCSIHSCLTGIQNLDKSIAFNVYQNIISYFNKYKTVTSDGISCISVIIIKMQNQFEMWIPDFWQYLYNALQQVYEIDLFKTAIGCVSDIVRSCSTSFQTYLQALLKPLLGCLTREDIDRQTKIYILGFLIDVTIGDPASLEPFLQEIIQFQNILIQQINQISQSSSESEKLFQEQLQEKVIEIYISIIHAFGEMPNTFDILVSQVPKVMQFMQQTCDSSQNPPVDYLRLCLSLIADFGSYYKLNVKNLIKTNFTQNLIYTLNKFNSIQENENIIRYAVHVIQTM